MHMKFLDRTSELNRLGALSRSGGLAVVTGRRRVGKTRLLVEWVEKTKGLYFVADQSSAEVQRAYLTAALSAKLPGLEGVRFSDWRSLLSSVAERAIAAKWRGPLVIDELPYLVQQSPELPSALQQFVDHEAKRAKMTLAIAGSSQRMMQGIVLDASAPLYGRASVSMHLGPLPPACAPAVFAERELVKAWTAWGGIPRYWELAASERGSTRLRNVELSCSIRWAPSTGSRITFSSRRSRLRSRSARCSMPSAGEHIGCRRSPVESGARPRRWRGHSHACWRWG